MTQAPLVSVNAVHKHLGTTHALRGVSFEANRGDVVCLVGPSGAGKTTMLRCINYLERYDSGCIRVGDDIVGYSQHPRGLRELRPRSVARQRAKMGMVFQHFNLFPHMSALENVTVGPIRVLGAPRDRARRRGIELLRKVGLEKYAAAYPGQLSGGQQQRVAIARALAMDPLLILLDEPTSALDSENVGEVLNVMADLSREGMTMIIVTHELRFARDVASRLIFMDEGAVVEQGEPHELVRNPLKERTRRFLMRELATSATSNADAQVRAGARSSKDLRPGDEQ